MPMDIDGFAVLGAIAHKPEVFAASKIDVAKTARTLVSKQIKEKNLTIDQLRLIAEAIHFDTFDLIMDSMSDADIKSVLSKVDKLNSELRTSLPLVQRDQVSKLARGLVLPASKAVSQKAVNPPNVPKPKIERSGNSKSARAKKKV